LIVIFASRNIAKGSEYYRYYYFFV